MVLQFFEPVTVLDTRIKREERSFKIFMVLEGFILGLVTLDLFFEILHRYQEMKFKNYVENNSKIIKRRESPLHVPIPIGKRIKIQLRGCCLVTFLRIFQRKILTFKLILFLIFWTDYALYFYYYPFCVIERYTLILRSSKLLLKIEKNNYFSSFGSLQLKGEEIDACSLQKSEADF